MRDYDIGTLKATQTARIDHLVDDEIGDSTSRPIPALTSVSTRPRRNEEEELEGPHMEAVGGLLWIANATSSDIADAVREVARQAYYPSASRWQAVLRMIQYLRGTRQLETRARNLRPADKSLTLIRVT